MLVPGIKFLFNFLSIVISSWLLVHLFGAFGVFIALAYPLWFLIAKDKTYCLMCNLGEEGSKCRFCGQPITKSNQSPKNFKSVILNMVTIVIISIVSAALVYVEYSLIVKYNLVGSTKTVKFKLNTQGTYRLGEEFEMKIELSDVRSPINVIQADLGFDPKLLEVLDINTNGSISSVFIEKNIKNELGYARISGGIPNPGYKGDTGLFAKVKFKTRGPGFAEVKFLASSVILANDGHGTNVLSELPTSGFLILDQKVDEYQNKPQTLKVGGVLGGATEPGKLYLYSDDKVLGASKTSAEIVANDGNPTGISNIIFYILSEIDHLIVGMWSLAINTVSNIFRFVTGLGKS